MNTPHHNYAPKRSWLLSNEDFTDLTNVHQFNEWALFILWDNGITCPDDAYNKLHLCRFEHTNPDCSFCGDVDKHYVLRTDQWNCKKCRRTFSVTSGTYLDNSKLEAHIWWRFCYLVGDMGITNSHLIAKDLGVTQKTAWFMLDTLRTARKETSNTKFINGSEVLSFNNSHEVIDVLVKIKRDKTKPVPDKSEFLKNIYDLILRQNHIPFKEKVHGQPTDKSIYKRTYLQFRHEDIYIEIQKKTRIRTFAHEGLIGEEKYLLCSPSNKKAKDVKKLYASIIRNASSPVATLAQPPIIPLSDDEFPNPDPLPTPHILPEPEQAIELSAEPPVPITEKQCRRKECQKWKPVAEFNKGRNKDGFGSYCRECANLVSTEYTKRQKETREKIRQERLASMPPVVLPPAPVINPELRESDVQEIVPESTAIEPEIIIPVPILEPERAINPLEEKRCTRKSCRKVKPLSEFHKGQNADGLQSWCKECIMEKSHERRPVKIKPSPNYGDNPEKQKLSAKKTSEEISKEKARKVYQRNQVIDFLNLKNR